jgi:uncharacterized membrane protein
MLASLRRTFGIFCCLLAACGARTPLDDLASAANSAAGRDGAGGAAGKGGIGAGGGPTIAGSGGTGESPAMAGSGGSLTSAGTGGQGPVDRCASSRCEHGGRCVTKGDMPVCDCPAAFTGEFCELPRFEGLGILPESIASLPAAISSDGQVVVGHCIQTQQAFRWDRRRGMTPLTLARNQAWAIATDAIGSVVVGSALPCDSDRCQDSQHAARWEAGAFEMLGEPDSSRQTAATGISADGSVIVGYDYGGPGFVAFRWTRQGGAVPLGPGSALDVSGDGRVIVGYGGTPGNQRAMRWSPEGDATELGALPGETSGYAYAANADGSVIVGSSWSTNTTFATRWSDSDGTTSFGPLPGDIVAAFYATSEDGSVAVGVSTNARPPTLYTGHALIWDDASGLRALESDLARAGIDIGGWKLVQATAVSANGRVITGFGTNPSGQTEAWIVRLP